MNELSAIAFWDQKSNRVDLITGAGKTFKSRPALPVYGIFVCDGDQDVVVHPAAVNEKGQLRSNSISLSAPMAIQEISLQLREIGPDAPQAPLSEWRLKEPANESERLSQSTAPLLNWAPPEPLGSQVVSRCVTFFCNEEEVSLGHYVPPRREAPERGCPPERDGCPVSLISPTHFDAALGTCIGPATLYEPKAQVVQPSGRGVGSDAFYIALQPPFQAERPEFEPNGKFPVLRYIYRSEAATAAALEELGNRTGNSSLYVLKLLEERAEVPQPLAVAKLLASGDNFEVARASNFQVGDIVYIAPQGDEWLSRFRGGSADTQKTLGVFMRLSKDGWTELVENASNWKIRAGGGTTASLTGRVLKNFVSTATEAIRSRQTGKYENGEWRTTAKALYGDDFIRNGKELGPTGLYVFQHMQSASLVRRRTSMEEILRHCPSAAFFITDHPKLASLQPAQLGAETYKRTPATILYAAFRGDSAPDALEDLEDCIDADARLQALILYALQAFPIVLGDRVDFRDLEAAAIGEEGIEAVSTGGGAKAQTGRDETVDAASAETGSENPSEVPPPGRHGEIADRYEDFVSIRCRLNAHPRLATYLAWEARDVISAGTAVSDAAEESDDERSKTSTEGVQAEPSGEEAEATSVTDGATLDGVAEDAGETEHEEDQHEEVVSRATSALRFLAENYTSELLGAGFDIASLSTNQLGVAETRSAFEWIGDAMALLASQYNDASQSFRDFPLVDTATLGPALDGLPTPTLGDVSELRTKAGDLFQKFRASDSANAILTIAGLNENSENEASSFTSPIHLAALLNAERRIEDDLPAREFWEAALREADEKDTEFLKRGGLEVFADEVTARTCLARVAALALKAEGAPEKDIVDIAESSSKTAAAFDSIIGTLDRNSGSEVESYWRSLYRLAVFIQNNDALTKSVIRGLEGLGRDNSPALIDRLSNGKLVSPFSYCREIVVVVDQVVDASRENTE